ncbi:MAG: hypothetical protein ACPGYY_07265 [Bacteroidia bacterium]
MKRILQTLILVVLVGATAQAQYYDSATIQNIISAKSAAEGDFYLDTVRQEYYIGLSNGVLSRVGDGSSNELIDTMFMVGDTLFIEEGLDTQQVILRYVPTYLCKEESGIIISYRLQGIGNLFINETDTSIKRTYQELLDSSFTTCESAQNILELTACKRREIMSDSSSVVVYLNDSLDVYDKEGVLSGYEDYSDWFSTSGLTVVKKLNCYDESCMQIGNVQFVDRNGDNLYQNLDNILEERSLQSLEDSSAKECIALVCQQVYGPSDFELDDLTGLPDSIPECSDLSATWFDGNTGEIFSWDIDSVKWVSQPTVNTVNCPQAAVSSAGVLLSSVGVSSINKTGTGQFTVNLSVPQSDSNYIVLLSKDEASSTRDALHIDVLEDSKDLTSFDVIITEGDNGTGANTFVDRNWYFSIPCTENFSTGLDSAIYENDTLFLYEQGKTLKTEIKKDTVVSSDDDNRLEEGTDGGAYLQNIVGEVYNTSTATTEWCTGTEQEVDLTTFAYNKGTFTLSSDEVTVPETGDYKITYSVAVACETGGEYTARFRLAFNNTVYTPSTSYAHAWSGGPSSSTVTRTVYRRLNANDTVEIRQIRFAGGTGNTSLRVRRESTGLLIERVAP